MKIHNNTKRHTVNFGEIKHGECCMRCDRVYMRIDRLSTPEGHKNVVCLDTGGTEYFCTDTIVTIVDAVVTIS